MSFVFDSLAPRHANPSLTQLQAWALDLGFSSLSVVPLEPEGPAMPMDEFTRWLDQGFAGDMDYLSRNRDLRAQPADLLPGAQTVLMVTMPYLPAGSQAHWRQQEEAAVNTPRRAVVSVYARGRDYHKVMRRRIAALGRRLARLYPEGRFRACVDSAPLMEVELAERAGLGWRGKNTLLLHPTAGSMFFLGALLTNLRFSASVLTPSRVERHCGSCTACLDLCPTKAFIGPYQLDARRCISYLTIEHAGDIPEPLRPLMGNRVYGCDDCQRVCPWNRFARAATLPDFAVRHGLDQALLTELFAWSEEEFHARHQGSAILRIGYSRWLRNLAVGLGNALASATRAADAAGASDIRAALTARQDYPDAMVARHIAWALAQEGRAA
ncbi:MAG: tRNA epoxyqueuosine(34) reductase QueG [Burkholderiaceae bacterium]